MDGVTLPSDQSTLTELLALSARRFAVRPALITESGTLDYAALDRLAGRFGAYLAAQGVRPGERVGLYCPNGEAFPVAYFGILKAGAVVVPVNVLLSAEEITFIYRDAAISALVHHAAFDAVAGALREALDGLTCCVRIGGEPLPGVTDWQTALQTSAPLPVLRVEPTRDTAVIIYTSGTTGRPKGAMLSHANLAANVRSVAQALQLRPEGEAFLVVLPMFHAFAGTVGMLLPLFTGASIVALARFDPLQVAEAIERHRASIFLGVPTMYIRLLELPDAAVAKLRALRACISGGAAMPVAVMRRFEERFGIPIHEGDGPTECGPVTCVNPLDGPRKPGSVGLPIPGVAMTIRDADGTELPDGEVGEICVRGPNVMQGYWRLPEASREAFFGEWFRTGDLGYRDADGYFFIVDRLKDMIIFNGINVYPRMVEEVLYRHPAVREAAVVGEPHPLHGEQPVAFVALKPGVTAGEDEIMAFCQRSLGRHEVPRAVHFIDELPKTATGKILKRALRRDGEIERGIDRAAH